MLHIAYPLRPFFISSIQLRYDYIWTPVLGRKVGDANELDLFDGEVIVQVRDWNDTEILDQYYSCPKSFLLVCLQSSKTKHPHQWELFSCTENPANKLPEMCSLLSKLFF